MSFHLFDYGDDSWFTGNDGDEMWSPFRSDALAFQTSADAAAALADCDEDELLRDRLAVIQANEEP